MHSRTCKTIEYMRLSSKLIARFVRDQLEDLHANWAVMNDATMPEINRAIRKWIYEYFYAIETLTPEKCINLFKHKQAPDYREDDCFDDIENSVNKYAKM